MHSTPNADRPLCKCHGVPMVAPSKWQCRVKRSERYHRDRERVIAQVKEYQATPAGVTARFRAALNQRMRTHLQRMESS